MFCPEIGQHNILLRCLPAKDAFQHVRAESFEVNHGFWWRESGDGLGNRIITGGTAERHDCLKYKSSGVIDMDVYCIPDAFPHPMYSMASRLTQMEESMLALMPVLTGNFLDDCLAIMHSVFRHMTYLPGITDVLTTAHDAFVCRRGVCQDYAHLMVTLCRAAGLYSRYVCGLMVGEGATHAWVEVHDGLCWYAFDPTNDTAVAMGYVKLAHGRDALDCSVSRGVYTGVTHQTTNISVTVKEI